MLHSFDKTAALALALLAGACSRPPSDSATANARAPEPVVLSWTPTPTVAVDGGRYRPLFPGEDEPECAPVSGFRIEVHPVTNEQFLAFVAANPKWRRSHAKRLFVGPSYLAHWASDLDLGPALPRSPVTNASWFAARAYASWAGRRLPTTVEWETVAAANASAADARDDPGVTDGLLDWYATPATQLPGPVRARPANFWGVGDMHGLIWEWLEDFNSAPVSSASAADWGGDRGMFCGRGWVGSQQSRDYTAFMRFAFRSSLQASNTIKTLGFRCVAEEQSK